MQIAKCRSAIEKGLLALIAPLALLAAPAGAQQGTEGLDAYITKAMADWKVPGLGVAIVKGDSVLYLKGFGVRELGKSDPVTPNTLFAIGSNTKSFTAAAVGMLVDEGKMRWDDKVTKHLPGFQLFDPYVTREITMRDVLSHRSGLGRRGDMLWIAAQYDRKEILRRIRFLEPNAGFRTEMGYQNIMFLAAGEAAGAASGLGWDALITARILQPLGMTRSTTTTDDLPTRGPDVSTPHGMRDSAVRVVPRRDLDNIAPAGSIYSSAEEMTHYVRFILGGGTWQGKQLLRSGTLAVIQTPHVSMQAPSDTLTSSTHFVGYGLGWVLQDYKGRKIAWHNGGIDGNLSEMWTVPEEKLGIVVLTNYDGHQIGPSIVYRVLDQFLGGAVRDWSAINLKRAEAGRAGTAAAAKSREASRAKDSKPSHALDAYAGVYADSLYGDFKVRVENGRLTADYGAGDFGGPMEHWQYDTFRATWRDRRFGQGLITFGLDQDGKVSEARVEGVGTFKRRN
jgi:CubicO group peptidase (beta-lactamase class C family)